MNYYFDKFKNFQIPLNQKSTNKIKESRAHVSQWEAHHTAPVSVTRQMMNVSLYTVKYREGVKRQKRFFSCLCIIYPHYETTTAGGAVDFTCDGIIVSFIRVSYILFHSVHDDK